ncbi:trehalose-phosphatase [Sphingomonas oryzagri]|uniref:Trehalose 6-phosphate phosphatase n=1 Tax=Sphingomonas oryzagri TaxID=3042314 RepID=A0ABT6MXB9_9SPHN|nr:trehalose-phosphatase [Sphingomonas oryzagri]MDH7637129.1 trehalose-phosphatase [Sphingomonas oryzagri]
MPDQIAPLAPAPDVVSEDISLFLDFDGTLVDIAERHDAVIVQPGLGRLIGGLAERLNGRVALVSGRSTADILSHLGLQNTQPPFAIAGSHGLELLWGDGRTEAPARPEGLDEALTALNELADARPGVVVEKKPYGAALHYRQAPDAGPACDAIAEEIAARTGITLQHGKMVVELRAHGADKGDAVRRFMAEPPMTGTRPIFIGDDLTDEAGFVAAEALGGWGILVGGPRETAARYRLPGVRDVHEWLGNLAGVAA